MPCQRFVSLRTLQHMLSDVLLCSPSLKAAAQSARQMLLRVAALLAAVAAKLPWQNTAHGAPSAFAAQGVRRLRAIRTHHLSRGQRHRRPGSPVVAATDASGLLPHLLKHYAWFPIPVCGRPPRPAASIEKWRIMRSFGVMGHGLVVATPARTRKVNVCVCASITKSAVRGLGRHADSDEFIVFDRSFEEVLRERRKADVVGGMWTDRVAEQGKLAPIPPNLWGR